MIGTRHSYDLCLLSKEMHVGTRDWRRRVSGSMLILFWFVRTVVRFYKELDVAWALMDICERQQTQQSG